MIEHAGLEYLVREPAPRRRPSKLFLDHQAKDDGVHGIRVIAGLAMILQPLRVGCDSPLPVQFEYFFAVLCWKLDGCQQSLDFSGCRLFPADIPPAHDHPAGQQDKDGGLRSEEHTSELQSLMRISYAVFCL